ncbi:phosphoenolpyruvate synthase [Vibrio variabilis]|uniref:Phosphoenolpyruvate synthase n=1 Tax=Vibrio variabilis TaxID=990271 RepID=A0ABR4YG53_9VIBR|nr:putative PEP-binding protein [Vibrio variabilis]KHA62491.1 phosphoenolpyruvate synthase [Vibrio variabilis]
MSVETFIGLHPALTLGGALPSADDSGDGTHLYVSFSELILGNVFYHPEFKENTENLSEVEKSSIEAILAGQSLEQHFVDTLVTSVKAAIKPEHESIRVSLSSADSYAFSSLLGGSAEIEEVNPALGLRGVSRYASDQFSSTFALECQAIKQLREEGIQVDIVVPFVRALSDAAKVIDLLAEQGLPRGLNGLKVFYTVDVPSAALLCERLLPYFDGVVINLENLAQFTLGVDRISEALEYLFDPQSEAVVQLLDIVVKSATTSNKPVLLTSSNLTQYPKIQEYILERGSIDCVVTL